MSKDEKIKDYDLNKSFERLAWRLNPDANGKTKQFYPNKNDLKALKNIAGWIDRQRAENIKNNHLFAKLYIHRLREIIRAYKSDVLEDINQKELSKLLSYPLEYFYKAFHQDLYNNQFESVLSRATEENKDVIFNELFEREYTEKVVIEHLNEMIAEALNRFS
ncbi:MAG: hypothetical protein KGV59_06245 [Tenacibaculum sp.]|nr:hypothetical protein [Tenacibaculum sp.]